MPKPGTKYPNRDEPIVIADFTGGLNRLVPRESLALNEAETLENWMVDPDSGALKTFPGMVKRFTHTSKIETLFIDNGTLYFSSADKLYKSDLSSVLSTYNLTGVKLPPRYALFDEKIAVATGNILQYIDKDTDKIYTISSSDDNPKANSLNADDVIVRSGRVEIYGSADSYLRASGLGDITNWQFADKAQIEPPSELKLTEFDGDIEVEYHKDTLLIGSATTATGVIKLTFDSDSDDDGTNDSYIVNVSYNSGDSSGESASTVAARIAALSFTKWTATVSGALITFTANESGKKDPLIYNDGGTGALGYVTEVTEGKGHCTYTVTSVITVTDEDGNETSTESDASDEEDIYLTGTDTSGVKLNWSTNNKAISYRVYGKRKDSDSLTLMAEVSDNYWVDDGSVKANTSETTPPAANSTGDAHTAADANKIEIGYKDDSEIVAAIPLSADLIVFKSNGKVFRLQGDYPSRAVYPVSEECYCVNGNCVAHTNNSVIFFGAAGLKSLATVEAYGSIKPNDIGVKIDRLISSIDSSARIWHIPQWGQIWIRPNAAGKIFVYSYLYNSFMSLNFNEAINAVCYVDGVLFLAKGNGIYTTSLSSSKIDGSSTVATYRSKRFTTNDDILINRILIDLYRETAAVVYVKIGKYTETFTLTASSPLIYNNTELVYQNNRKVWTDNLIKIKRRKAFQVPEFDITIKVLSGRVQLRKIVLEVANI